MILLALCGVPISVTTVDVFVDVGGIVEVSSRGGGDGVDGKCQEVAWNLRVSLSAVRRSRRGQRGRRRSRRTHRNGPRHRRVLRRSAQMYVEATARTGPPFG